jgi:hypothetical protein
MVMLIPCFASRMPSSRPAGPAPTMMIWPCQRNPAQVKLSRHTFLIGFSGAILKEFGLAIDRCLDMSDFV